MGLSFVTDLAKEVANEVTGIFGFSIFPDGLSFPVIDDWNDIYSGGKPNKNFKESLGYGFAVLTESHVLAPGWAQFDLQINPQTLQQDEEFSIQFFPTPTGITVEHQGSIMKDIMISGVTGVHPKRGAGGVDIKGDIIFGKGDSGYKQFHDLRNYVRSYVEHKKNPQNKSLQLAFFNFKDEEYFLVEPTRFSLKRSENRPLMYEYSISMRTIGRTTSPNIDTNLFDTIIGTTAEVFDRINNGVRVARGTLNGSIELLRSIDREVRSKVLSPLQEFNLAVDNYVTGKTRVLDIPRKFCKDLAAELRELEDKLADSSGVDTTDYNTFVDRIPTSTVDEDRTPTYEESMILNTIKITIQFIMIAIFNKVVFLGTTDDAINEVEKAYGVDDLIEKSNSTETVQILDGDTIQDIAARELGDGSKFDALVVLNDLKYPYIATEEELEEIRVEQGLAPGENPKNILTYDDKIMIPRNAVIDDSVKNVHSNIEYEINKSLPQAEKNLGVDIALNKAKDIALTNNQDYDLIGGAQNVVQAIGIRLGVEPGGYKLHVNFGVNVGIGEKNLFQASILRDQIEQQLTEDSRIEKGTKVQVRVRGNIVYVTVYAKIKSLGQAVPLQLASLG